MMIPVVLVTGFLGSGKTTLLARIIARQGDRRLAFLVNEFSGVDVDGPRLAPLAGDRLISLPGGSIFCQCLAGEFLRNMQTIVDRFHSPADPLAGLVIEASGMADPRVFARMLAETRLDRHYRPARVLCMVDPGSFLKLRHTLAAVTAQVEAADLVLINKVDLHPPAVVEQAEAAVREIHPGIEVRRTRFGETDVDLFAEQHRPVADGPYAPGPDPQYSQCWVNLPEKVDPEALRQRLEELGEAVFRVKGFVCGERETFDVDVAAGRVRIAPADARAGPGVLTIIYPPASRERVDLLVAWLYQTGRQPGQSLNLLTAKP